ncbi:MAG: pitrilysin family protein [Candidatus Zixiibacteriota bacterium]
MRSNWLKIVLLAKLMCFVSLSLFCGKAGELEVVQVKKPGIPVVYFEVMIKAGSAYDPPGKEGLAYFTAELLDRGTASFSRDEIDELLDFISARLSVEVNKEVIVISGTTLKENLDKFYQVYSEIILKPTFPEDQIEKTKLDQLDAIENTRQRDRRLVSESFDNFIHRGHPYGHLVCGNESSVNSLTRQDALSFYHKHFLKNNILLGLAGDFDDQLVQWLRQDMSTLNVGQVPEIEGEIQPIVGRRVLLIEKEKRAQTQFRIGHPFDLTRHSPDYFPMLVANAHLGKHRESIGRLYKTVRMERGLCYGAYSYIEHFEQFGWGKLASPNCPRKAQYFSMWTYPKCANAKFAMKLCLKEMTDLATNGIPEDKLEFIKSFEKNQFPFQIETPQRKLAHMMAEKYYGTFGFVDHFESEVEGVTKEKIDRAAQMYLSPDNVAIVALVSDAEEFIKEVLSDQTVIEYPSQANPTMLREEDDQIKAFDLKLTEDDFEIVKASELFK